VKTIKTIYFVSLFTVASAATAAAAEPELSLKFDDQYKPGQLIVSAVNGKAAAAGVVPGDALVEICTVPASADHAAKIAAIAAAAGASASQAKNGKAVCAPVKTISDKMTIVAPFDPRGAKAGWAVENTMKFKRENGQTFTASLANSY